MHTKGSQKHLVHPRSVPYLQQRLSLPQVSRGDCTTLFINPSTTRPASPMWSPVVKRNHTTLERSFKETLKHAVILETMIYIFRKSKDRETSLPKRDRTRCRAASLLSIRAPYKGLNITWKDGCPNNLMPRFLYTPQYLELLNFGTQKNWPISI